MATMDQDGNRWDENGKNAFNNLLSCPSATTAFCPDQQAFHGRFLWFIADQRDGITLLNGQRFGIGGAKEAGKKDCAEKK